MAEVGTAFVSIVPSMKGFSTAVGAQGSAAGSKFSTGFKVAALAGVAVAAAKVGRFVADSISEARDAQKVGAQTAAVIKSTGAAANVTASQIGKLATAISKKTGIDDEQIQASQNMLLTFTNVKNEAGKGNDIFNQATKTITDMSVALGQSGTASAMQLGKALNDPIKGVTALQRVGVTFTDQQKQQIAAMVKAGNTAGAQKIILTELGKEFGGSAAAQATATQKMSVAWGNLKEAFGTALLPAIDKVTNALTPLIEKMTASKPAMIAIAVVVGGVLVGAFAALAVSVIAATWPFILIGVAVAAVVAAVIWAWKNFETFRTVVTAVFEAVAAVVKLQITVWVAIIKAGIKAIVATFNFIKSVVGVVIGAWNAIKSGTTTAWNAVTSFIQAIPGKIVGFFKALPGQIQKLGANVADGFLAGVKGAWSKVSAWISKAVDAIPKKIRDALGIHSPSRVFAEIGRNIGLGLVAGMDGTAADINAATNRLRPTLATGNLHSSVGIRDTSADRPVYAETGALVARLIETVDGRARLVLNDSLFAASMAAPA